MRRNESGIDVTFGSREGRSFVAHLAETGALRLRLARTSDVQAIIVNTAGGIVEGDELALAVNLDAGASATLTSAAAEKVYRSSGGTSQIDVRLDLASHSRLLYVPHETIVFDRARLRRRFDIACAADTSFLAVEMLQFGRVAHGETHVSGMLRESWRLRRDGRLVYADEVALDGDIGGVLDRHAVAGGCCAVATILLADRGVGRHLDPLRSALDAECQRDARARIEAGASLRDDLIVVRLLAASSERLRSAVAAAVRAVDGFLLPPYWD